MKTQDSYILVTGSLAFDQIMDFPGNFADNINPAKIHLINLSFLVETLKKERGGTAGNIAYSLALLKSPVKILASAGDDFTDYGLFLKKSGVGIDSIKIIKGESTSQAFIVTDKKDNQIAAFYPGAMNYAPQLSIKKLTSKPGLVVISPTHPGAMVNFARECQQLVIPYLYDPGMQLARLTDIDLKKGILGAQIVIGNDYEMALIRKRLKIKNQGGLPGVEITITTLGEKGALIQTLSETIQIKAVKVKNVVDPTGAGDSFRSGFLSGRIRNFDLKTCGGMGAVASAYAVENYGTSNHLYTLKQFCSRYQENYGKELKLT